MINSWAGLLTSINRQYPDLLEASYSAPVIKPKLLKKKTFTELSFTEHWKGKEEVYETEWQTDEFEEYIQWCEQQLSTWKNVKLRKRNAWRFKKINDAEKFITLFYTKWTQQKKYTA